MDTYLLPVKVIYARKNKYKQRQYQLIVFVGEQPDRVKRVLEKIKNMSYREALKACSENELEILRKQFHEKWHLCFWPTEHLRAATDKNKTQAYLSYDVVRHEDVDMSFGGADTIHKEYAYDTVLTDDEPVATLLEKLASHLNRNPIISRHGRNILPEHLYVWSRNSKGLTQ